jgi:hypothetical protein
VLGYYTWLRVLVKQKNHCPFTRLPVTRRHLVKLTPENIDEYRDKITNMQCPGGLWGVPSSTATPVAATADVAAATASVPPVEAS